MGRIRLLLSFLCVAFALARRAHEAAAEPRRQRRRRRRRCPHRRTRSRPARSPTVKTKRALDDPAPPPLRQAGRRLRQALRRRRATSTAAAARAPASTAPGFVRYVYGHFGISLAHSSYGQFDLGRRVGRWALRPGDLVFFDGLGHVGMYIGNGRFIHAPHTGTRVRIETLAGWYGARFVGGRRLRSA